MQKKYLLPIMLLALSLFSCSHKHDHDHDHDHDHEDMLQLVAYNDMHEVFVEATPLAINEESKVTAFVSNLCNFKPVDGAEISATLLVGGEQTSATATMAKEGIYTFKLTPKQTGAATLSLAIAAQGETSTLTFDNLMVYEDEHEAEHAAHDAHPSISNGITFNKAQSWKVGFATQLVERTQFGQIIKTTAQVQPSSGDERIITAKASGVVVFQDNNTVPGRNVASGQRLFYIDASEMADNNLSVRFLEVESEYNRAKAEYDRKAVLAEDNIVSQSELLQAKTDLANAEAQLNNLKRNFTEGKQSVSSPIAGYINSVMVRNGEFVEVGQPILKVSQNRNLFIQADLQPKYYNKLASIGDATIKIPANDNVYSLEDLNGKVISYGKSSDMSNPLIPVTFQVNNNIDLIPGSFVDMYIKLKSDNMAVTVPNGAIVEEMGAFFVMVQVTPELFEKRAIIKGETDGFSTHIIEGVSENERVVSKGAIFVKLAQDAGALDPYAGHVH